MLAARDRASGWTAELCGVSGADDAEEMGVGGSRGFPFNRTCRSSSSSESDETGARAVLRRAADPDAGADADAVAAVGFLRSTLESDELESESLVSDTAIAVWGDQAIVSVSGSVAISIDIDVSRGRWEPGDWRALSGAVNHHVRARQTMPIIL
jgi:hypothetical protein